MTNDQPSAPASRRRRRLGGDYQTD
uniref:Uncharacterized protein n=1 Tax=Arundo donax TaxID=35708 RepID=A0A0A9HCB9_ARUDO